MSRAANSNHPVGYKRPPREHQFQKGRSGNPAGRPRKTPDKPEKKSAHRHAELDDILLKEALRPITVRENDEVIVMPMIQAVLRSLGVAAVKGHHRSQVVLANMVKEVQAARFADRQDLFRSALEYKDNWREAIEAAERRGETPPEPVPHPDEIVLDANTMDVRFNGPMTLDEKAEWDRMAKRRAESLEEIAHYKAKLKRRSKYSKFYEEEILHEQKLVDIIDAVIPSEATRRRPGFDIHSWREANPKYHEMRKRAAQRASKSRKG